MVCCCLIAALLDIDAHHRLHVCMCDCSLGHCARSHRNETEAHATTAMMRAFQCVCVCVRVCVCACARVCVHLCCACVLWRPGFAAVPAAVPHAANVCGVWGHCSQDGPGRVRCRRVPRCAVAGLCGLARVCSRGDMARAQLLHGLLTAVQGVVVCPLLVQHAKLGIQVRRLQTAMLCLICVTAP